MPKTPPRDSSRKPSAPTGRSARPAAGGRAAARSATPASPAPSRRAAATRREGGEEDSRASFLKKLLGTDDTARSTRPSVAERREQARRAARQRPSGDSDKS